MSIQINQPKKITLTPTAAAYVRNILAHETTAIGFRLGVKNAGCSSKKYFTEIVTEPKPDEQIFEADGINIFVSSADLLYVAGTEIDCVKKGLNQVLQFNNPRAVSQCGCGESFDVDTEA